MLTSWENVMDALPARGDGQRIELGEVDRAYCSALHLHRVLVRAYLCRQVSYLPAEDLQDLEQEVWLAVWRSFQSFAREAALATWLIGVTKNILNSWLRGREREQRRRACIYTNRDRVWPEPWEAGGMDYLVVRDTLQRLPDKERSVLCLRYFEGMTDREIARKTGLALGTVKGRLRSGLSHLRAVMRLPLVSPGRCRSRIR